MIYRGLAQRVFEAAGVVAALALSMVTGQPDESDDGVLRRLLARHGAYFQ